MPAIRSDVPERIHARSHSPWPTSRPTTPNLPHRAGAMCNPSLNLPSGMESLGQDVDLEATPTPASIHRSALTNDNSNMNALHAPGNIVNSNPSLNIGPGATVHLSSVVSIGTHMPDPLNEIQTAITAALKERHVPQATYDAQPGKGCMKGTRVQVLRDIGAWILNPQAQQIFWLAGMAGMGKTAIAQTVCWYLHASTNVILGGSFFCSRSTGSVAQRDVRCVIPTLAQLFARQSTEFSVALAAELKRDPDVLHKQADVQIKRLLYTPLLALKDSNIPILFVIDALDECGRQPTEAGLDNAESHRIVSEMLEALVDFSRESAKLPVKFLVTSRPETHIRDTPVSDVTFSSVLHLHTVNKEQVTADIRLYIDRRLSSSTKLCARLTDVDVDMLARLSDGLFIVAETALKHILAKGIDAAASRFNTLLNSAQDGLSSGAAAPLDCMYRFILEEAAGAGQADTDELQELLKLLASLLSARKTLSVAALSDLIGMSSVDVRARLSRLHSVLYVPDEDHEPNLRTLHASFGDYLLSRATCNIRISASLGHDLLSRGCLRVMAKSLHFNVSQSRSSYISNQETRFDAIGLSLEYACLQWIHHVAAVPLPSNFDAEIDAVFRSVFLYWLEVISVLGAVWPAAAILLYAASTVRLPNLSKFFRDANAFVTSSQEAIERSASHIYLSALPFAPKDSLVYQIFAPQFTGLISVDTFGIDRHGGRHVMTLNGDENGVTSITYSPDGHFIASGSPDSTVRIWDTRTGRETMTPLHSGDGEVQSMAFSPQGQSIVAGTGTGVICIWSLQTSRATLQRLSGHTQSVLSVAFSSDGRLLASASADKSVRLWKAETGVQVAVLDGHTDDVNTVAFSPDGATFASGSKDHRIRLWHAAEEGSVGRPLSVGMEVFSLCFSPDSTKLAVGGKATAIQLWNCTTRTFESMLNVHSNWIRRVQFSLDGRSLFSASDDLTLHIWTLPRDKAEVPPTSLERYNKDVRAFSLSPDGLYIASASSDRTIRIWDAANGQQAVHPLPADDKVINSVAVSPCGSFIVSGSNDPSVRVWDMRKGDLRLEPLHGHTEQVCSVTISSDGSLIASASADGAIRLWNAQTGKAVGDPLTGHESGVMAVAFSSDTRWLASGSFDRTVRLWDVATRQLSNIATLRCTRGVLAVGFSPDGGLLAAGDISGHIHLWHANTVCKPLHENDHAIRSVNFSPDGTRIVAGRDDNMARVWDSDSRQQLLLLEGHSAEVLSAVFSSDSELICSSSADCTVRLWSATTGMSIATLRGHTDSVNSVTFTSDGQSVVSCSRDKTIRVWDVDTARLLSSSHASDPAAALASATLKNGWLVGPSGELLAWVPEKYREYLQLPPCTMLIGRHRIAVTVGDNGWHHGTNWTSSWRRNTFSPAPRNI